VVQLPSIKLGLIAANRGFFSDELAAKMRNETIAAMREAGIEVVVPDESMTKLGCVETLKAVSYTHLTLPTTPYV
jgi:L-fucose isomerase-like protein